MQILLNKWVLDELFPEYKKYNITKLPRKKKKKVKKYISKNIIKIVIEKLQSLNEIDFKIYSD